MTMISFCFSFDDDLDDGDLDEPLDEHINTQDVQDIEIFTV